MAVVGTGVAEGTERLEVALLGGDLARRLVDSRGREGDWRAGSLGLEVVACRVAFFGLLGVAREYNQTVLVRLQPFDIQLLALLAQVSPPVVDRDAKRACLLTAHTRRLELAQSESTALTDLEVVPDGRRTDGWTEEVQRAHAELGGLDLAILAAAKFTPGLVEPCADAALPVLSEVVSVEDVVVGETHFRVYKRKSVHLAGCLGSIDCGGQTTRTFEYLALSVPKTSPTTF